MEPSEIADEISRLSLPQKLILTQDIWDSIALENGNLPLPEWQKYELEKRYNEYRDGKMELYNWQEVHKNLREKYK